MDFEELKENLKHLSSTVTGAVVALTAVIGEFGYNINIPADKINRIGMIVMALYLVVGIGKKKEPAK